MDLQIVSNHEKIYLDFNILRIIFHIGQSKESDFFKYKEGIITRNQ
jgi:hypothetical protein